jgi:hypothetical protein
MCQRKENEPWVAYVLRYVTEQPKALMAIIGFAAAAYMYFDLMTFVRENTAVQRENVVQLQEINVRLNHLEREHEYARKKDEE